MLEDMGLGRRQPMSYPVFRPASGTHLPHSQEQPFLDGASPDRTVLLSQTLSVTIRASFIMAMYSVSITLLVSPTAQRHGIGHQS